MLRMERIQHGSALLRPVVIRRIRPDPWSQPRGRLCHLWPTAGRHVVSARRGVFQYAEPVLGSKILARRRPVPWP
jgi:hypothetical protein